jgi:hypothetical protein
LRTYNKVSISDEVAHGLSDTDGRVALPIPQLPQLIGRRGKTGPARAERTEEVADAFGRGAIATTARNSRMDRLQLHEWVEVSVSTRGESGRWRAHSQLDGTDHASFAKLRRKLRSLDGKESIAERQRNHPPCQLQARKWLETKWLRNMNA